MTLSHPCSDCLRSIEWRRRSLHTNLPVSIIYKLAIYIILKVGHVIKRHKHISENNRKKLEMSYNVKTPLFDVEITPRVCSDRRRHSIAINMNVKV